MTTYYKKLLLETGFIFALLIAASFIFQPIAVYAEDLATECRVVRIYGGAGETIQPGLRVESDQLLIRKGTCVIWLNWARFPEVNLAFEKGKRCMEVTQSRDDFKLDTNLDCLTTNLIGLGHTASLRFMEAGTYKYTITGTKSEKINGEIIVR